VIGLHTFVMLAEVELAQSLLEGETVEHPSTLDFIEKLNPDELEIESIEPVEPVEQTPRKTSHSWAIVIDGLSDDIEVDDIVQLCPEDYRPLFVVHIVRSLKCEGKNRAVIYPTSKSVMNKMYQFVNGVSVKQDTLLPIRIQSEDVPEAPPFDAPARTSEELIPKNKRVYVVVDPIPDDWNEEEIHQVCEKENGSYTLIINGSAKVLGRRRALLQPTTPRAKKRLPKILNREVNGVPLRPFRVLCAELAPSLSS
jgi:hypothetical protein